MKKYLLIVMLIFLLVLTGCNKQDEIKKDYNYDNLKEMQMSVVCNNEQKIIDLNSVNEFNCNILNKDYTFIINNITDDTLNVSASESGLTRRNESGTISLLESTKDFVIEKSTEVTLVTQTTDYSEEVIIYWK